MNFACRIDIEPDGRWRVRHQGPEVGQVEVCGASREEALAKMQAEIEYRLELCPCTGHLDWPVQLVVSETSGA